MSGTITAISRPIVHSHETQDILHKHAHDTAEPSKNGASKIEEGKKTDETKAAWEPNFVVRWHNNNVEWVSGSCCSYLDSFKVSEESTYIGATAKVAVFFFASIAVTAFKAVAWVWKTVLCCGCSKSEEKKVEDGTVEKNTADVANQTLNTQTVQTNNSTVNTTEIESEHGEDESESDYVPFTREHEESLINLAKHAPMLQILSRHGDYLVVAARQALQLQEAETGINEKFAALMNNIQARQLLVSVVGNDPSQKATKLNSFVTALATQQRVQSSNTMHDTNNMETDNLGHEMAILLTAYNTHDSQAVLNHLHEVANRPALLSQIVQPNNNTNVDKVDEKKNDKSQISLDTSIHTNVDSNYSVNNNNNNKQQQQQQYTLNHANVDSNTPVTTTTTIINKTNNNNAQ